MSRWIAICISLFTFEAGVASAVEVLRDPQTSLCARAYQQRPGSRCVPLVIPANAHIDSSGHDWQCNGGFRKKGNLCERQKTSNVAITPGSPRKIVVPPKCGDHRDTGQGGRSPDLLRRCD